MHGHTSQEIFDDLQAFANTDIDVASEDAISFVDPASDYIIDSFEDLSLQDDTELAALFEMLATRSSGKKQPTSSMSEESAHDLPPLVRFSRTNRI
mmetsp:Transcript_33617/g.70503  ORF Transcript_33617/g.70503 Transcript_33617/m.70503 type:complete len:96 (-) Transcript_33617:468-755(-)